LVLRTKLRIARNAVRNIRSHLYVHAAVGIFLVVFLIGGGAGFFYKVFDFLMDQPVFGAPLMDQLVSIVLLVFFAMLLFSNLIITLSTTYISREVEFLMALPISRQSVFRQKLIESVIYSSWAFAILSLPLFVSFGIVRRVDWYVYPLILALVIPFLIIPATLGAIVTMVVTSILPARKTRILTVALGILSVMGSLVMARVTGLGQLLATAQEQDFLQIMNSLAIGNSPILPSAWLANALQSLAPSDPADRNLMSFLYWFGMLLSTALFLWEFCRWLVGPLYYRGWCLSRDAAVQERGKHAKLSPFRWVDRAMERSFPPATAGLLSKDLKTFWRDPSQWTQLVILFGLMVIYVTNLGYSRRYSKTLELVLNDWKMLVTFFNLAATCFILSILTTRFVYPMLSLEGRGFWTVGLAPIPRTRVVWQKYVLCMLMCLMVALPLMMLSNYILHVTGSFVWISMLAVFIMALGLTSLSVGIGAIVPDFKEDNPARIANGIGGTLNVLLSLAYIAFSVALMAFPAVMIQSKSESTRQMVTDWLPYYIVLITLFQVAVITVPLRVGLKRWNRMEF
jgi:ABC-2 type transport system permease protein